MIVWIDGAYGVGKSSVTNELKSRLKNRQLEHLDSDTYQYMLAYGGGCTLQNNIHFLKVFKEIIENKIMDCCNLLIVEMALTQNECKKYLFDSLKLKHQIIHVILMASEETIATRIKSDSRRDKGFALEHLAENNAFLKQNYPDAVFINTQDKSIMDICDDILAELNYPSQSESCCSDNGR